MEKPEVVFKTNRLYARMFQPQDIDKVFAVNSDPEVMRYIGPVQSREEAQEYLDRILEYYELDPGFGKFAIHLRKNNEFIGWVVLQNLEKTDNKELGYRLSKKYWGNGYASEIAAGALEYGFWDIELPRIVAIVHPENTPSIKIIEKLQFRYKRMAHYYGLDVKYYVLRQDQWERDV